MHVIRENRLGQDIDTVPLSGASNRRGDDRDILTRDEVLPAPGVPRHVRKQSVCLVRSPASHCRRPG